MFHIQSRSRPNPSLTAEARFCSVPRYGLVSQFQPGAVEADAGDPAHRSAHGLIDETVAGHLARQAVHGGSLEPEASIAALDISDQCPRKRRRRTGRLDPTEEAFQIGAVAPSEVRGGDSVEHKSDRSGSGGLFPAVQRRSLIPGSFRKILAQYMGIIGCNLHGVRSRF